MFENPLKSVKRHKEPPARERRLSDDEIERLLFALGYEYAGKTDTVSSRVGATMLFAIETAMRARAALNAAKHKEDGRSHWVKSLAERHNKNIATVALANKNARIARSILSRGEDYRKAA